MTLWFSPAPVTIAVFWHNARYRRRRRTRTSLSGEWTQSVLALKDEASRACSTSLVSASWLLASWSLLWWVATHRVVPHDTTRGSALDDLPPGDVLLDMPPAQPSSLYVTAGVSFESLQCLWCLWCGTRLEPPCLVHLVNVFSESSMSHRSKTTFVSSQQRYFSGNCQSSETAG